MREEMNEMKVDVDMEKLSIESRSLLHMEIEKGINNLISLFTGEMITEDEYDSILFFCTEVLDSPFIEEGQNDKIEEVIYFILEKIKQDIYNSNFTNIQVVGAHRGVGLYNVCMRNLKEKGRELNHFASFFNGFFEKYSLVHKNMFPEIPSCSCFDSIYGISGILYNMLFCNSNRVKVTSELVSYLAELTKSVEYNGGYVIKYLTEKRFIHENVERESAGFIDFGVAHGIMGPLIALSKAREDGIVVSECDRAIEILLEQYNKFVMTDDGVLKYPTKLPFPLYTNVIKDKNYYTFNSSWCYGNAGIVRGLMKSAKYLKRQDSYQFYKKELLKIIEQPADKYGFSEPYLCHGYASIITIQLCAYRENQDKRFINTLDRNVNHLMNLHSFFGSTKEKLYKNNYSLLEGCGGVILTMLETLGSNLKYSDILMMK